MKKAISKLQKWIANQDLLIRSVIKLYNQTRIIIGYRFAQTKDFHRNGEFLLLKTISDQIKYFVDVGANTGDYIHGILNLINSDKIKIHAYEPSGTTFQFLAKKAGNLPQVEAFNIGLGSRKQKMIFYENPVYSETSSFVNASIDGNTKPISVLVDTIDNLYFDKGTVIDFLKIDTEGFDYQVLLGSKKMLGASRIRFLQFEYNEAWKYAGNTLYKCIELLNDNDYLIFIINPDGLYTFDYSNFGEFFRYSNFFSMHSHYKNTIKDLIKGKR
jgi:FkbM family methyltransferase